MNFKNTYALFGALIAMVAIAAIMLMTGNKPGDDALLLPSVRNAKLSGKDIDSLTIERKAPAGDTIAFQRVSDNQWKMTKPVETRADTQAVDRILDDILSARREGKTESSKNLAQMGLEPPSVVVTCSKSGGPSFTVSFGNTTPGANGDVFAVSSDRPTSPIAIHRTSLAALFKESRDPVAAAEIFKDVPEFRSRDLLLAGAGFNPAEQVQGIKLSDGKTTIALAKKDNAWKFETPDFGPAETKGDATEVPGGTPSGVEQLIKALVAIKPANVADFVDGDPTTFGLGPGTEAGPRVELARKPTKGDTPITETLLIGKKDEKTGQTYVRVFGEKFIAKVDSKLLDAFTKVLANPSNLRDRQLLTFNPNECDAVDIKLAGDNQSIELRRIGEPGTWKLFATDATSQNANAANIRELLAALGGKAVKDFPDANATDAALGFDHPAAELTLWVHGILPEEKKEAPKKEEPKEAAKDNAAKPEPKATESQSKKVASEDAPKDKAAKPEEKAPEKPVAPTKPKLKDPDARLIFGKRDKDLLFVRRVVKDKDGKEKKTDFAISESIWSKLTRGRIEYIDPALPTFAMAGVQKLSFNRGAEQFVVEKQDKTPPWIIRQPADRADRAADPYRVEQLLGELVKLRAERLWSEKPSDRELERYGLNPPRTKATVTIKDADKTQDRVYSFGAETDDKTGIYARQSDRDVVFVVRKDAISGLQTVELQDALVYEIDRTKVTGLKLTGWKDVVGQATTRDLERKGTSNWALRGDDKTKLNAAQCESFLNVVSQIRAESFVTHKSGPKPEQKLTVAAGALEISIAMEGEKDPITLTIGGLDADGKNYFAMSSKLAGDVFLLPKTAFEAVKAKPGYFNAE